MHPATGTGWISPAPSLPPVSPSSEGHKGARLIFNIGGYYRYYPSYESDTEYERALESLVLGALAVLNRRGEGSEVAVSDFPRDTPWIGWLLPMYDLEFRCWRPGQPLDPDWDPLATEYASLFVDGTIPEAYAKTCVSRRPRSALRFCADAVTRNLAPYSWFFSRVGDPTIVYFRNTSTFGVLLDDPGEAGSVIDAVSLASPELVHEYESFSDAFRSE